MSKIEAEYDGIESYYDHEIGYRGSKGAVIYKIPCEKCGKILLKKQYSRARTYLCEYCRGLIKNKKKALLSKELNEYDGVKTNKEKSFDKAVDKIKKQVKDFSLYNKPIQIAYTRCERYGSIPEAMVAIELLKLGYSIIPQQKVTKYKVDFAIPKQKIVIEVDGSLYHKERYGGGREATIQLALGMDWRIIHIPAELIAEDIQKLKTIIDTFS